MTNTEMLTKLLAQSGWVVVDGDAFALTPPVPADPAD